MRFNFSFFPHCANESRKEDPKDNQRYGISKHGEVQVSLLDRIYLKTKRSICEVWTKEGIFSILKSLN